MSDSLKSVAIVVNSYFGPFMMQLAQIIKNQHGCDVHLYCKSDILVTNYCSGPHAKLFASVSNFMRFPMALRDVGLNEAKEFEVARKYEERLGVTYNTLAVSNRHIGRGYALGGFHHPGSRYAEASYLQMVHAYNVQLEFWEKEFCDKGITLVLADNKEIALVASHMGVVYRSMARARYKNYHYWEEAETREAKSIQQAFQKIPPCQIKDEGQTKALPPYMAGREIIKRAMKRANRFNIYKRIGYLYLRQTWWLIRGYEKAKGYYINDQVKQLFRQRRDIQRMLGSETVGLEQLTDTPFVYYPLHTEPEQSLGQISPEFFFQLAAIAALSRDLPVGVKLAVKDVPMACGRRPDNFYDQLFRFKNVVVLNIAVPGPEAIKRAIGVATIAGTGGLEAALLAKPVISFGRHNPYNFLPHVEVNLDLGDLPRQIQWMVSGGFDQARARGDAKRFIEAIKRVSFDMGEFDYFDLESFPTEAPRCAYKLLLLSLTITEEPADISV